MLPFWCTFTSITYFQPSSFISSAQYLPPIVGVTSVGSSPCLRSNSANVSGVTLAGGESLSAPPTRLLPLAPPLVAFHVQLPPVAFLPVPLIASSFNSPL